MSCKQIAETKEILSLNRLTKKRLLELCKKNKLYQTPSLNDVLYLHYQGFQFIECLEEYTELKCLWLECNAISEIQGLENQTKLKCLFLQSNLIRKIENLEFCKDLDTINLSQNHIRKIENCGSDVLPVLNTLNISSNYLKDCEGLKELEYCRNLSVLDLSNNRIDDILVVKIFGKMLELKVLVLQGNPVVSKIPQYRKTLILECKKLTYLDSRPVFPKDRACAEAWKRGGYEEERKENDRWNRKERKKMRDGVNATIRLRNKNRKPEDQLTLITSSDSETETNAKKCRRQNELNDGASMDSIWDEVANDSKSETASSDMNVSSSASMISTTDSNCPDTSSDTAAYENKEIQNIDEEKIINDSSEINTNVVQLAENENMENILKFINNCGEKQNNEIDENSFIKKCEKNQVVKEREDVIDQDHKVEEISLLNTDTLKEKSSLENSSLENGSLNKNSLELSPNTFNTSIYSDEDSKNQYKSTVEAKRNATLNNISQDINFPQAPIKRVQLQIDTIISKEDENYEPLKELEEAMHTLEENEHLETKESLQLNSLTTENIPKLKTSQELEYEQECLKVNHQLKKDFQQLSTNMDIFMTQLHKDKEERMEAMDALFDIKNSTNERSSVSSGNEDDVNCDEWRVEHMFNQCDRETRLKGGKRKNMQSEEIVKVPTIYINDQPYQEEIKDEQHFMSNTKMEENKSLLSQLPILSMQENRKINKVSKRQVKFCEEINTNFEQEYPIIQNIRDEKYTNSEKIDLQTENNIFKFCSQKPDVLHHSKIIVEDYSQLTSTPAVKNKDVNNEKISAVVSNEFQENSQTEKIKNRFTDETDDDFKYIPMDLTLLARNSQDSINSFEKESKQLKELLQRLENENEDVFKEINLETKCQSEELSNELSKENGKKDLQEEHLENELKSERKNLMLNKCDVEVRLLEKNIAKDDKRFNSTEFSVGELLEDIIQSLEFKSFKPRSYEFHDIGDSEYRYSKDQEVLQPSETIPDIVESFNLFLKDTASRNREKLSRESLERYTSSYEEKPQILTADKQISDGLKKLANQEDLKDLNNYTHKSPDVHLEDLMEEQNKQIRNLVDRVYAQKDRYDDTLEVIDGKLMVRNKDTGEVNELPKPVTHYSDSDTDYDTAQSEEEQEGAWCSKPIQYKNHDQLQDAKVQESKQREWLRDYHTQETSSTSYYRERLRERDYNKYQNDAWSISEALYQQKHSEFDDSDSNSDASHEEFFSLDTQGKPNIYGNIDDTFFNTLTLEHLKLSEQDENHIMQCSRSYEELKSCLKISKEEIFLTEEENELQKIIERKSIDQQKTTQTNEEDKLLEKLLKRTKEKERFDNESLQKFDTEANKTPYQICNKAVRIFEYNNENKAESFNAKLQSDISESFEEKSIALSADDVYTEIEQYDKIKLEENEKELNSQDFMPNLVQREISFQEPKKEINFSITPGTFSGLDKYSEEEKNEFESNIDVEGIAIIEKFECAQEKECSVEKPIFQDQTQNFPPVVNTQQEEDTSHINNNTQSTTSLESNNHEEISLQLNAKNLTQNIAFSSVFNFQTLTNELPSSDYTEEFHSSDIIDNSLNSPESPQSTTSPDIDVLECNLEIIDCNDELIDTITVNAELHYNY